MHSKTCIYSLWPFPFLSRLGHWENSVHTRLKIKPRKLARIRTIHVHKFHTENVNVNVTHIYIYVNRQHRQQQLSLPKTKKEKKEKEKTKTKTRLSLKPQQSSQNTFSLFLSLINSLFLSLWRLLFLFGSEIGSVLVFLSLCLNLFRSETERSVWDFFSFKNRHVCGYTAATTTTTPTTPTSETTTTTSTTTTTTATTTPSSQYSSFNNIIGSRRGLEEQHRLRLLSCISFDMQKGLPFHSFFYVILGFFRVFLGSWAPAFLARVSDL